MTVNVSVIAVGSAYRYYCMLCPAGPRPAREATDSGAPLGDSFRAKNKDNVNILKFLAENLEKEQVMAATLFCSATHVWQ